MNLINFPTFLNAGTKQVRIAIVDGGYLLGKYNDITLCKTGHKDFTTMGLRDFHGHGTHITNTILSRLNTQINYCVIIVKWYDPRMPKYFIQNSNVNVFEYLLTQDVDIINYSAGGIGSSEDEKKYIAQLLNRGVKVFVAAGNDGANLNDDCYYFPACYNLKGLRVVGALDKDGKQALFSNYGKIVTDWELGVDVIEDAGYNGLQSKQGTSQATAISTSKYVNRRFK